MEPSISITSFYRFKPRPSLYLIIIIMTKIIHIFDYERKFGVLFYFFPSYYRIDQTNTINRLNQKHLLKNARLYWLKEVKHFVQ